MYGDFRIRGKYKELVKFLIARLIYNDGLITVFAFGGIYAAGTFGFSFTEVFMFGIILNIMAGIGAFLMGFLDDKIGGKKTIQISNIGSTHYMWFQFPRFTFYTMFRKIFLGKGGFHYISSIHFTWIFDKSRKLFAVDIYFSRNNFFSYFPIYLFVQIRTQAMLNRGTYNRKIFHRIMFSSVLKKSGNFS